MTATRGETPCPGPLDAREVLWFFVRTGLRI